MSETATIVQRLWNYCNVLRDDGMSYGDYVEQLTYLLFLKMDYENREMLNKPSAIADEYNWKSLFVRDGEALELHYRTILSELGKGAGLIPVIFRKAQNKIQDPAKLRQLIIDLIDKETWTSMSADVKGDAYEGLLERERPGHEERRGTVFHAARAHRRYRGLRAAPARRDRRRPRLRHRWLPPFRT